MRTARMKAVDKRYSVDEEGNVWSKTGGVEMPLEPINGVGVNMYGKRVKICYLVARAFVPNQEMRPYVRHKNGDPTDNRACNLEWSETEETRRRGRRPEVRVCKAWNLDGELVGCWRTVQEAADRTGAKPEQIRACLNGKQKFAAGLLWRDA